MAASLFREESRTNGRVWRDRGASPGHAVNPSMETSQRHPWRWLSRQGITIVPGKAPANATKNPPVGGLIVWKRWWSGGGSNP